MKLLSRSQSSEATCRRQPPTQIAMPITMQMQMGNGDGDGDAEAWYWQLRLGLPLIPIVCAAAALRLAAPGGRLRLESLMSTSKAACGRFPTLTHPVRHFLNRMHAKNTKTTKTNNQRDEIKATANGEKATQRQTAKVYKDF